MINKNLINIFNRYKECLYKKYSKYHHVEYLEGPRVLVLSPHPDDDIFGCGGTLSKHIEQEHIVKIIYLCNGGKGIAGINENAAKNIRREEAIHASKILGIHENKLLFLNIPDLEIKISKNIIKTIQKEIDDFEPNIIYLPSFLDNHPDHITTNMIITYIKFQKTFLCAYEVWTPIIPNRLIDISGKINVKIEAIKAHKSQLDQLNYLDAIKGLNQYRGCTYHKKSVAFGEAFLFARHQEYLEMMKNCIKLR